MPINPKFKDIEHDDDDNDDDDFYDAQGRQSKSGIYDASGHLIHAEKLQEHADYLREMYNEWN